MRCPSPCLSYGPVRQSPRRRAPRRGYTLLEVLLALAIGALLMLGLYFALNIQMGRTASGRKLVERTTLARPLTNRIQNDILNHLSPANPRLVFKTPGSSPSSATGGGTTNTTQSSTTPSSNTSNNTTGTSNAVYFNLGVQGDSTHLVLYISKVPGEVIKALTNPDQAAPLASDLRRVTYWQAGSGSGGLARQEVTMVTSDDEISNLPPNVSDEARYIIHPE